MPELPEVETVLRQLAPWLVGRTVQRAGHHPSAKFAAAREATGARITAAGRRGKYLLFSLDDQRELVIHLGMTGQLRPGRPATGSDPHVRARWALDDGSSLEFRDVRRFGRIAVVPTGRYESMPTLANLGPEPLTDAFEPVAFAEALRRSRRAIKTQLLGQRVVAGVGNIYGDEALWEAGINPAARRLSAPRSTRLHGAIRLVLQRGIDNGGTTLRDYRTPAGDTGRNQHALRCYGRAGRPCERCGTALRRKVIDARSTTWCPTCQTR